MIEDVIANDYLLGVSLAGKALHIPEMHNSESPTKRNLTLYEPNTIFGCGPIVVKERLSDGRTLIDLHVMHKVEIVQLIHTLPYYLSRVHPLPDEASDHHEAMLLVDGLRRELLQLARGIDVATASALENQTHDIDLTHMIALILGVIRFPGEFKQQLLEQDQDIIRGKLLLAKLPELFPHITH